MICDEYADKDERILVFHKKNGGASYARNIGIEQATGDYILFLDGDDYWLEIDLLEKVNERINQFNSDVICLNYKKVYSSGKEYKYFSADTDMPEKRWENHQYSI